MTNVILTLPHLSSRFTRTPDIKPMVLDPLSITSSTSRSRWSKSQMIARLFGSIPDEEFRLFANKRVDLRFSLLDEHYDDHHDACSPISDASSDFSQSAQAPSSPCAKNAGIKMNLGEDSDDGVRALLCLLNHADHSAASSNQQTPEAKPRELSSVRRASSSSSRRRSFISTASTLSEQDGHASHQVARQEDQQVQHLAAPQADAQPRKKSHRNSKRPADVQVDANSKRRRHDEHHTGHVAETIVSNKVKEPRRSGGQSTSPTAAKSTDQTIVSASVRPARPDSVDSTRMPAGQLNNQGQLHPAQQYGQMVMERPTPDVSLPGLLPPPSVSPVVQQPTMGQNINQTVTQTMNQSMNQQLNIPININQSVAQLKLNELSFQQALQSLVGVNQNNPLINQSLNQLMNQNGQQGQQNNYNQEQIPNINQLINFSSPQYVAQQQQQQQLLAQLNQQQQQFLPSDPASLAALVSMASRSIISQPQINQSQIIQSNFNQSNGQTNNQMLNQMAAFGNTLDPATAAALANVFQSAPSMLSQSITQSLNPSISQSIGQSLNQPINQQQSANMYFPSFSPEAQAQNNFQQQIAQARAFGQIQQLQQMQNQQMSQQAINLQQWMQQ